MDTEGEEQEEEGLSNTDANGNEEGDSSSTKKACVDWISMLSTRNTARKKEEKDWSSACCHFQHVVPNKKPGHLESHLSCKHCDVYEMVESINEERREEILKRRMLKSTRFDEKFVHKIDPSLDIPGRWAIRV